MRSRLERELKAAGDAHGAAEIHRLRRPHLAAWACNQLARDDPDAITELFDVTAEVAAAQQGAIGGGDADELRAATRRRQDVLDDLTNECLRRLARSRARSRTSTATTSSRRSTPRRSTRTPPRSSAPGGSRSRSSPPAGFGPLDLVDVPGAKQPRARRPSSRELDKARRELEKAAGDARQPHRGRRRGRRGRGQRRPRRTERGRAPAGGRSRARSGPGGVRRGEPEADRRHSRTPIDGTPDRS